MYTKEELALTYVPCRCDEAYKSRGLTAPDCPYHSTDPETAMDVYAQQQAIAFDIWKLKNHWLWNSSICKYFKWEADNKHETNLSHEELYLQFIEHQKQTENK